MADWRDAEWVDPLVSRLWALLTALCVASALVIVLGDAYLRLFGGRTYAYAVRRDIAPNGQCTTIYEIVVKGAPQRFRESGLREKRPPFDYLPLCPAIARPRQYEPFDYVVGVCAGLLGFGCLMAYREHRDRYLKPRP